MKPRRVKTDADMDASVQPDGEVKPDPPSSPLLRHTDSLIIKFYSQLFAARVDPRSYYCPAGDAEQGELSSICLLILSSSFVPLVSLS